MLSPQKHYMKKFYRGKFWFSESYSLSRITKPVNGIIRTRLRSFGSKHILSILSLIFIISLSSNLPHPFYQYFSCPKALNPFLWEEHMGNTVCMSTLYHSAITGSSGPSQFNYLSIILAGILRVCVWMLVA